ncbi:MAG: GntR family transcriptional regulator [Pseudomonadota bacterium]
MKATPHSFAPLKRSPAYQKVYDAVESDILSGRLAQDSLLPTEGELAEQFNVHRSTVREGLRLLEQAGLIRRGPAKRMIVVRPESEETATRAGRSLALHGVTFHEVWEAIAIFQPAAARHAAKHLDADQLDALDEIVADARRARTGEEIVASASAFLQQVAAAGGNRVVLVTLQSLNQLIASSLEQVVDELPRAGRRIADAQSSMIGAFRAGDEVAAAAWMQKHIDDLKRGYEVAGAPMDSQVL